MLNTLHFMVFIEKENKKQNKTKTFKSPFSGNQGVHFYLGKLPYASTRFYLTREICLVEVCNVTQFNELFAIERSCFD